jgi:hypothetical protein
MQCVYVCVCVRACVCVYLYIYIHTLHIWPDYGLKASQTIHPIQFYCTLIQCCVE